MTDRNPQDANVGNLGDILKHAALVQLAKIFGHQVGGPRYYLESHSYLYQSRLVNPDWQSQSMALQRQHTPYQAYIALEMAYIKRGEYLCSSGLVNKVLPDAHLLLCESNKATREWLLQQLADNKVAYHTVKAQLTNWALRRTFRKLANLLALIDPFTLPEPLWLNINKCLSNMLHKNAPAIILVFDYAKQADKQWPDTPDSWLTQVANISAPPYHLGVYTTPDFVRPVLLQMAKMGWQVHPEI